MGHWFWFTGPHFQEDVQEAVWIFQTCSLGSISLTNQSRTPCKTFLILQKQLFVGCYSLVPMKGTQMASTELCPGIALTVSHLGVKPPQPLSPWLDNLASTSQSSPILISLNIAITKVALKFPKSNMHFISPHQGTGFHGNQCHAFISKCCPHGLAVAYTTQQQRLRPCSTLIPA